MIKSKTSTWNHLNLVTPGFLSHYKTPPRIIAKQAAYLQMTSLLIVKSLQAAQSERSK